MASPHLLLTLPYKKLLNGEDVLLDIYLPISSNEVPKASQIVIPAVVFFHGGGLTAGSKDSFIPLWLLSRVISLGYAFVSPNYQLIPPATAHEIKQDVLDVFTFLVNTSFEVKEVGEFQSSVFKISQDKIVVSGSSAGGLCAYLATAYATPKPKALLSIYAMGGNFLSPKYIDPKASNFERDPKEFEEYTYPFTQGPVPPHTEVVVPQGTGPFDVPKLWLMGYYFQLGTFADYYTGCHEPSLGKALQAKFHEVRYQSKEEIAAALEEVIPVSQHGLFPQILATRSQLTKWPPTLFIHGTKDKLVNFEESVYMKTVLEKRGVSVELIGVEGEDHAFYYGADAEEKWGWLFERAIGFVKMAMDA